MANPSSVKQPDVPTSNVRRTENEKADYHANFITTMIELTNIDSGIPTTSAEVN